LCAQLFCQLLDVHLLQEGPNGLGPDLGLEAIAMLLLKLPIPLLVEQFLELEGSIPRIHHDIFFKIQNLLQVPEGHVEEIADAGRNRFEKPDVDDAGGQLDMPQALAPHLGPDYLYPALITHDVPMLDPLKLAAVALPVLGWTEDLGTEQPVAFRLKGPVVDRFRLFHLAMGPRTNLLGRGQGDPDRLETRRVDGLFVEKPEKLIHASLLPLRTRTTERNLQAARSLFVHHEVDIQAETL
jgi:hypothetical protein